MTRPGREFAQALAARARAGVRVRIIYDWLGAVGKTSRRFWRDLRAAGVEVRCFNPPSLASPFAWLSRDHRKMLAVDGRVAFVTGLCVGRYWVGDPARGIEPWRDTGIGGPGARGGRPGAGVRPDVGAHRPCDARRGGAGAGSLAAPRGTSRCGSSRACRAPPSSIAWTSSSRRPRGGRSGSPTPTSSGRPPTCRRSGPRRATASTCGCSCPARPTSGSCAGLSRAGYRPLLEAGVRVYEWNGTMLHAKTAVADGRWARVGLDEPESPVLDRQLGAGRRGGG